MNPFFEYLIKSTISLSLLYLLFKVFMQNDKTLALNRFLLLGILIVSAIIPLLNIQLFYQESPLNQAEAFRDFISFPLSVSSENLIEAPSVSQPVKSEINYWMFFYGAAVIILLFRLLVSVGRILQLIQKAEKQKLKNIVLAVVKEMIQPFTFLNHVVISKRDFNENKNIVVAHEQAHIKQLHAIDLAVCEVFTLLHFFNPLMWLMRRDLKLNHEYLADQAVLNKGIDAQKYQLLVLQKAVGERRFALANNFSQKPILKRFKMMKKRKSDWQSWLKIIVFLPALLFLFFSFSNRTNYLNYNGDLYKINEVVIANESFDNSGKFEINLYGSQKNKDLAVIFYSTKTESVKIPEQGNYKYFKRSYNHQNSYNFNGIVEYENSELEINKAEFNVIDNSLNNFKLTFRILLANDNVVTGQFEGPVVYKDWRSIHELK